MNQEQLVSATKTATQAVTERVQSLTRALSAQVAAGRHLLDRLLGPAGRLIDAIRERMSPFTGRARAWIAEHDHLLARPRAWARTFGLHRRPAQAVGTLMILGVLSVAIWDPFARPAPDAPAIVAERTAPIGTVNLLAMGADQIADERDADAASVSSIN